MSFLIYFAYCLTIGCGVGKSLFPCCMLSLCTNDGVICSAEAFHFHEVSLSIFELCACANNFLCGKSFLVPMRSSLFPIFSFNKVRVSSLMLRSLIHLELSFVQGDKYGSISILLHAYIRYDQHHLLKTLFSSMYYWLLYRILGVYRCVVLCLGL